MAPSRRRLNLGRVVFTSIYGRVVLSSDSTYRFPHQNTRQDLLGLEKIISRE